MGHINKRIFVFNLFEFLAPQYDRLNDWLSLGQHHRWRASSLKLAGPLDGKTVLDLCCGSGDYVRAVRNLIGQSGTIVGLDFSPKMLQLAKDRIESTSQSAAGYLLQADALHPPIKSNSIDLITIGFALRNVEDLQALFKVSHLILNPGGMFLALELSRQNNKLFWLGHRFYLRHVIPYFGKLVVKARGPTHYLAHSIEELPSPGQIVTMLHQAGFNRVRRKRFMFGAISAYFAEK